MRRAATIGALAVLVVLAGCTGLLGEEAQRDEDAVAAVEESRRALDGVESYRYDMDLRIREGTVERVDAQSVGAANVTARRMNATARVDGRTRETYLINRTSYRQCPRPGAFWGAENRTAEEWIELTPAASHLSLLSAGDLRMAGAATVGEREATRVVGEPPAASLQDHRGPLIGGPSVRDVTLSAWIDNVTRLPLKTRLTFTVVGEEDTLDARLVTRYRDYGAPVTVTLPDAARERQFSGGCVG